MIVCDLWDRGIDVSSPAVLRGRSWSWLRLHVEGLLTVPPQVVFDPRGNLHRIPQTRLALALEPPAFAPPARAAGPSDDL